MAARDRQCIGAPLPTAITYPAPMPVAPLIAAMDAREVLQKYLIRAFCRSTAVLAVAIAGATGCSAAGCSITLSEKSVADYLTSNITMLKWMNAQGYTFERARERLQPQVSLPVRV
jgi:hypothetical protein